METNSVSCDLGDLTQLSWVLVFWCMGMGSFRVAQGMRVTCAVYSTNEQQVGDGLRRTTCCQELSIVGLEDSRTVACKGTAVCNAGWCYSGH